MLQHWMTVWGMTSSRSTQEPNIRSWVKGAISLTLPNHKWLMSSFWWVTSLLCRSHTHWSLWLYDSTRVTSRCMILHKQMFMAIVCITLATLMYIKRWVHVHQSSSHPDFKGLPYTLTLYNFLVWGKSQQDIFFPLQIGECTAVYSYSVFMRSVVMLITILYGPLTMPYNVK